MKKEPLSIVIVKTLLAVTIFTGIGTIIFGGGVLIVKFYNSEINGKIVKPVNQEAENYYDLLESKCAGNSCCVSSLKTMRENNYKEADESGECPEGFYMDMMKCITSYQWCVPTEETKRRICEQDCDCVETQAGCCSCRNGGKQIGINKKYLKDWEDALEKKCQDIGCITLFNCKEGKAVCKNNKCEFEEKLNDNDQFNTSDWLTYRNEEFGFEIDYKSFNSKVCGKPSVNDNELMFCLVNENNKIVPYSDFRISVLQNSEKFSAKEFVENKKKIALSLDHPWHSGANMTEQETKINGYDAYLYNNVFGGDCGMKIYYIVYEDKTINISFTELTSESNYDNMEYNLKIFNQMLSTFRFIEK